MEPEQKYKLSKRNRNLKIALVVVGVFALETAAYYQLDSVNKQYDLSSRVTRELSNQINGSISVPTGEYSGDTILGDFEGTGEFDFSTGSVYTGEWVQNQMSGIGTFNNPDVGTYEGDFLNSQRNGNGVYTWNDGTVYTGEWKDDQMSGEGEYTTPDGVQYTGTFLANTFVSGTCQFENETGAYLLVFKDENITKAEITFTDGTTYVGECTKEGLSGEGVMVFPNEDTYSGTYGDGERNGSGCYTWESGDKYEGDWVDDEMSGEGTYTFANGNYIEGSFENNVLYSGRLYASNSTGEFVYTLEQDEVTHVKATLKNGVYYSADIKNSVMDGDASITYINKDVYLGKVKNGVKSGQGTYTWSDGARYEGAWSNDTMNGEGEYYYAKGTTGYKVSGTFKNGVPNGTCMYYVTSTECYQTDWTNGKCVKIYE